MSGDILSPDDVSVERLQVKHGRVVVVVVVVFVRSQDAIFRPDGPENGFSKRIVSGRSRSQVVGARYVFYIHINTYAVRPQESTACPPTVYNTLSTSLHTYTPDDGRA